MPPRTRSAKRSAISAIVASERLPHQEATVLHIPRRPSVTTRQSRSFRKSPRLVPERKIASKLISY
uniref:Putative non-ribosomal peptide synthase n=1 Tax=Alcaligenes sp. AL3007 TaxID=206162 RepID=Q8GN82_9BURK|nr:putative non-ribosomal peptide synthase [Alcaligenes sp. AL3007]